MSTLKVNNITDLGDDAVVTSGVLDTLAVPAGGILQVNQTVKTDFFSTTSTSFTDITGLSVDITPRSTSSKILVIANVNILNSNTSYYWALNLQRDGANIAQGTGGSVNNQTAWARNASSTDHAYVPITFLDSPSTTSTVTYSLQTNTTNAGGPTYVNGTSSSSAISSITVMEVAG